MKKVLAVLLLILIVVLAAGAGYRWWSFGNESKKRFQKSREIFGNPLMGYAPSAWHEEVSEDISLLYMDITWAELEPKEGVYAWNAIEEENQTKRWKEEGRHMILRFVCDIPGDEKHMDIPKWLYEKTGEDGTWYDGEYGKGYSPDYNNEIFIEEHERAIKALGEHFGKDGLISYIELGSLGHWGEWHVNYSEGITRIPVEAVRNQYVIPWMEAFSGTAMLMRRPFHIAEDYGMGLYNDMTGYQESTQEWLTWIKEGGDYGQAEEEDALKAMPDFWKTAPSGGEFTSSVSMEQLLVTDLDQTVELIRKSHTTFLGPKYADIQYKEGYEEVLLNMGYRLWISEAVWKKEGEKDCLWLTWNNDGVAPFYQNWPVYLYLEDPSGKMAEKVTVNMLLSSVLPETRLITKTAFETQDVPALLENGYTLSVGAEDPMTEKPNIRLAMECIYQDGRNVLWKNEKE